MRLPQSETRTIRRFVEAARQIGLDGILGKGGFAEDQCVELVNPYSRPRFCRDMGATPERVLDETASHPATRDSPKELAQVLRFSESNSTWAASLPEVYRLPPLATGIRMAQQALQHRQRAVPQEEPEFALPEAPAAYLARLPDRRQAMASAGR